MKRRQVVWRGSLTAGPPPGVAAIQRCAAPEGRAQSKGFRGRQGDIFVPGLPWRCRDGRHAVADPNRKKRRGEAAAGEEGGDEEGGRKDDDPDGCGKAARVLRKQPSRLELVQKWGGSTASRDGVDVKFKFGARHTWSVRLRLVDHYQIK